MYYYAFSNSREIIYPEKRIKLLKHRLVRVIDSIASYAAEHQAGVQHSILYAQFNYKSSAVECQRK